MDLKGGNLVEWLKRMEKRANDEKGETYWQKYIVAEQWLNKNIHPEVVTGAMLADGGYLTDHGPEHVRMVIARASDITRAEACDLSPYEVYLLILACHFHDVGNIEGRDQHELRSEDIIREMSPIIGEDRIEHRVIWQIAQAHGGTADGDKDKLSKLPVEDAVLGSKVRFQKLAAILKFADELADDSSRASRYLMEKGKLPKSSEVYHKYASCLHSVMIDHEKRRISLKFWIQEEYLKRKW